MIDMVAGAASLEVAMREARKQRAAQRGPAAVAPADRRAMSQSIVVDGGATADSADAGPMDELLSLRRASAAACVCVWPISDLGRDHCAISLALLWMSALQQTLGPWTSREAGAAACLHVFGPGLTGAAQPSCSSCAA
jgi:hypothetical protein